MYVSAGISGLRMRKEVENFLAKHGLSNDKIPIGCVKAIYYGNQTFWNEK